MLKHLFTLLGCALSLISTPAWSQYNYPDFSSVDGLNVLPISAQAGNRLRLTPHTLRQSRGNVWTQTTVNPAQSWRSTFRFQCSNLEGIRDANGNRGCDGVVFVLQPISNTYQITTWDAPVLCFWFDAFDNIETDDVSSSRLDVRLNGIRLGQVDLEALGIRFRDEGIHETVIAYDGSDLTVELDGIKVVNFPQVDLSSMGSCYAGFHGFVGDAAADHDILSWSFQEDTTSEVSGKITLQGAVDQAQSLTFEFRPIGVGETFTRSVTLNADRTFSITGIPPQAYRVRLKGAKWLARVVDVDTSQGSVRDLRLTLLGGDANNDNVVNLRDLALLRYSLGSRSGDTRWNPNADLNCDDIVNLLDIALIRLNFGLKGDP